MCAYHWEAMIRISLSCDIVLLRAAVTATAAAAGHLDLFTPRMFISRLVAARK